MNEAKKETDTRFKEQIALDEALAALEKLNDAFPHLGHQWKVMASQIGRLSSNRPATLAK